MTILYRLPGRNKYKCDICGKVDSWSDEWSWYGSEVFLECCPDDIPMACSTKCRMELQRRVLKGSIKLPELELQDDQTHYKKMTERQGY
jgi:hypothetical protein